MFKVLIIWLFSLIILNKGKRRKSIYNSIKRECKDNKCNNLTFIAHNMCLFQCIDNECFIKYFQNNLKLMGEIMHTEEKLFEDCVKKKHK